VAKLPGLQDLNIGHNIVARAVLSGMEDAVRDMIQAMKGKR
jgi:pyridoxine 5-phosphate synthase